MVPASDRPDAPVPSERRSTSWFERQKPMLQFLGLGAALYFLMTSVSYNKTVEDAVFEPYLELNASAAGWLLTLFGETGIAVIGRFVGSLEVSRGCDAVEPSALFIAAVVAFPAPLAWKIGGVLIGVPILLLVNLVRIVSLYYFDRYFDSATFDMMHLEVWQTVFVLLAFVLWMIWAWKLPTPARTPEAAGTPTTTEGLAADVDTGSPSA